VKDRTLILWRHGRTAWNVAGRVQGHTDTDLDEVGRAQAAEAAARLAALEPARIFSSHLKRASDTAAALARFVEVDVELDSRFQEVGFGEREGLTSQESWERFGHHMRASKGSPHYRFPGAETTFEAAERFAAGLHDVIAELPSGETAVIVTHGGVARVGACKFLGLAEDAWFTIGGLNNCSWSVLTEWRFGDEAMWRLMEWNAGTLPEPILSDDI